MTLMIKYSFYSILLISLISIVSCSDDGAVVIPQTGVGGSLATFTILGEYLYILEGQDLIVFSIENLAEPELVAKIEVGNGIETLYPFKDRLFIGSQNGMYTWTVGSDGVPVKQSLFEHIESCDPVVANDNYAYVTLRSIGNCRSGLGVNRLDILNISDLQNPILIKSYGYSSPIGMALDGDLLFLCDYSDGLYVLDVSDPYNVSEIALLDLKWPKDAISLTDNLLLVITSNSVIELDYSDLNDIKTVSTITTEG